jgi:hypothetical protein
MTFPRYSIYAACIWPDGSGYAWYPRAQVRSFRRPASRQVLRKTSFLSLSIRISSGADTRRFRAMNLRCSSACQNHAASNRALSEPRCTWALTRQNYNLAEPSSHRRRQGISPGSMFPGDPSRKSQREIFRPVGRDRIQPVGGPCQFYRNCRAMQKFSKFQCKTNFLKL